MAILNSIYEVNSWLNRNNIQNYIIRQDNSVDVRGNVDISNRGIYEIPVKFNIVNGSFNCSGNKMLDLTGSPILVYGDFDCSNNKIISLRGGPSHVYGTMDCSNNRLTTLQHAPLHVEENFWANNNELQHVLFFPEFVGKEFSLEANRALTYLQHIKSFPDLQGYRQVIIDEFDLTNFIKSKIPQTKVRIKPY